MSEGKKIVQGLRMYGTTEWVDKINETRPIKLPDSTIVANGNSLADSIDKALSVERRKTLKEAIAIAEKYAEHATAKDLRALLYEAEWGRKPEPDVVGPQVDPLIVRAPK